MSMKTNAVVTLVYTIIFIALFAVRASAEDPKKVPEVTVTIIRARGYEYSVMELEGELKGKNVRYLLLSCEVVIDNHTGQELTVESNFFSAFDGLRVLLLREAK